TGEGSDRPIFLAVKPQSPHPATNPTAISTPHSATVRYGLNTPNDSHANKVPAVPGAMGDKPLPNPSDTMCSGCDSMKRTLARRAGGVCRSWPSGVSMGGSVCMKMVEALQRQGNRLPGGVAPADGGRVIQYMFRRVAGRGRAPDCTDGYKQYVQPLPDAFDF